MTLTLPQATSRTEESCYTCRRMGCSPTVMPWTSMETFGRRAMVDPKSSASTPKGKLPAQFISRKCLGVVVQLRRQTKREHQDSKHHLSSLCGHRIIYH